MTRGGEAPGVAELGQDRDARELADAEVALQGQAAGLPAGEGAQLRLERPQLLVDVVDQGEPGRDRAAGGIWQLEPGQLRPACRAEKPRRLRHPVVEELRLDA